MVNRIQNIRKANGFDITDKITVRLTSHSETDSAINKYKDYIAKQVLADSIEIVNAISDENYTDLDFDSFKLQVSVTKA